jgi:hypothetical protein
MPKKVGAGGLSASRGVLQPEDKDKAEAVGIKQRRLGWDGWDKDKAEAVGMEEEVLLVDDDLDQDGIKCSPVCVCLACRVCVCVWVGGWLFVCVCLCVWAETGTVVK